MTEKRLQKKLAKIKTIGEQRKRIKELEDSYAEFAPDRKKRKVSNVMLITIVSAIVGYVVASFWLQYRTGIAIDPTITTCWFGFWTAEIIALTTIKNNKTKHYDNTCE